MQSLKGITPTVLRFFKLVSELVSDKDSQIARFSLLLLARIISSNHTYVSYFVNSFNLRDSMGCALLNSSILGKDGDWIAQLKEIKIAQKAVKQIETTRPTVYIIKRDQIKGKETLIKNDMITLNEYFDSSSSDKHFLSSSPSLFEYYYILYVPKKKKIDLKHRSGKKNKAIEAKKKRISLALPMNIEKRTVKQQKPISRKFTLNSSTCLPLSKNPYSMNLAKTERSGFKNKNSNEKVKNFYSNSHLKLKNKTVREDRDHYFNIYQKKAKNGINSPSKHYKPKMKNKTNRRITLNLKSVNFATKSVYIPKISSNRKKPINHEKRNVISTGTTLSSMFDIKKAVSPRKTGRKEVQTKYKTRYSLSHEVGKRGVSISRIFGEEKIGLINNRTSITESTVIYQKHFG